MSKVCTLSVVSAACLTLCSSGSAIGQVELYFTEYLFNNPRIKAIGTDGTNVRDIFTLASPTSNWLPSGLATSPDGRTIYWANSVSGSVRLLKGTVDGAASTQMTLASAFPNSVGAGAAQSIRGASLDAQGRVYFQTFNAASTTPANPAESAIRRVNSDGTGLTTIRITGDTGASGAPFVDATNGHVYFMARQQIVRTDLDGGNLKVVVRGSTTPLQIALDRAAGYIYWIDVNTNSDFVGRARLDGSEFTVLRDMSPSATGSSQLVDIVLDKVNGRIYLANDGTGADRIYSMALDGSDLQTLYTSPTVPPGTSTLSPSGLELSTGAIVQPLADCNSNGVADDLDITSGVSQDCNVNGVPDSCETDPCPTAAVLLDAGSDSVNTVGRAVGSTSAWVVFQPFVVPAGGWRVGQIGLDGFTVNYVDGSGLKLEVLPDVDPLATGPGLPDETPGAALATVPTFNLRFDTLNQNWVYAGVNLALPQGVYWLKISPNQISTIVATAYSASLNLGTAPATLPAARFRGTSGVLQTATLPIAVRLIERPAPPACRADFDGSGTRDVSDIFAFLSAWFAASAGADFDNSGVRDVSDIFAFLSAWFAGCP